MARFKLVPESHLFLVRDGRILLLRRANTDYEDGKYSVVAGHIEDGETAREAICREAREEAGIKLSPDDLAFAQVVHRADRGQRVGFFFSALRWRGEPRNAEPHKGERFRLVPARCAAGRHGALRASRDRALARGRVLRRVRLEPVISGRSRARSPRRTAAGRRPG
jgi:ADP-ribose pyrophosphatase YjhB (NUDIX family)